MSEDPVQREIDLRRSELAHVRELEADWKRRGSPEPEGAGVRAKVEAAEQLFANAISAPTTGIVGSVDTKELDAPIAEATVSAFLVGQSNAPVHWAKTDDTGRYQFNLPPGTYQVKVSKDGFQSASATVTVGNGMTVRSFDLVVAKPSVTPEVPVVTAHADHVAAKRARTKPAKPRAPRDVLNSETDARFWAQTGYKVGQKLDPKNATDAAMAKVWLDIFHKVEAEDAVGHLVTTYDHPDVAKHLQDAAVANQVAVVHLDAAASATDLWEATRNVQAAATADAIGQDRAGKAAAYQPPTASPVVAHTAATDAHHAAGQPPPGVIVFPVGHPAKWHPSAQPARPELATPNQPPASPSPPTSAADNLALAQAARAPKAAGNVHARGAADDAAEIPLGDRPPAPAPPKTKFGSGTVAIAAGALVAVLGIGVVINKRRQAAPKAPPRRRPRRSAPAPLPSLSPLPAARARLPR